MTNQDKFLKILFDPNDQICVSSDGYAYHSISQKDLKKESINLTSNNSNLPNKIITPSDINLVSINPIKGPRNDQNVTSFRSFLVELDEGSLPGQMEYIKKLKLPFSICVFSGNKSLHFGVCLENAYPNIEIWRYANNWILNIVKRADQQTKNPSRSIRFLGNKRKNGKRLMQSLVALNNRIPNNIFNRWLENHKDEEPVSRIKKISNRFLESPRQIPFWIKEYWDNGVSTDRNSTWFRIACWFVNNSHFDIEQFIQYWEPVFTEESDFKRKEWETTIQSAFKTIIN